MWNAPRRVEAELLDVLRPEDPQAVRSRKDLRRLNAWMLQSGTMARALRKHWGHGVPRTLADLGAGDGTFMLGVAKQLAPDWPNLRIILHDRQNIVSGETCQAFRSLGWEVETVVADVFDFLEHSSDVDVITANLFVHHFSHAPLTRLLEMSAQRTRLLVACEPRRAGLALIASRWLWAIGCNHVTRHDAAISVRAGFNDNQISELWPNTGKWELSEQPALLFTHCFAARRAEATT